MNGQNPSPRDLAMANATPSPHLTIERNLVS